MSDSEYQIVAATPGRDSAEVERIADHVSHHFGVDLSGLLDALSDTGVCVGVGESLEDARQLASTILDGGGDYRILDAEGNELESADAPLEPSAPRSPFSKTIAFGAVDVAKQALEIEQRGGFASRNPTLAQGSLPLTHDPKSLEFEDAGGFASVESTISEGAVAVKTGKQKLELEGPGGFASEDSTIGQGSLTVGAPEGQVELLEQSGGFVNDDSLVAQDALDVTIPKASQPMSLEEPGGFAAPDATIGQDPVDLAKPSQVGLDGLDQLDEQSLVLLDGTSDSPPQTESIRAEAADFIPPMMPGDESLELDSPVLPEPATVDHQSDESPDYLGNAMSDSLSADEGTPLPPFVEEVAPEVQADAERSGAGLVAHDRGARSSSTGLPSVAGVTSPPSLKQPSAARRGRPATSRPSGFRLLDGKLHQYPRWRVAAGFALTLCLSSILPMCHARSVRAKRIEPLRVDLATAKAHGDALAGTPGYRPPEIVEGEIASLRRRHAVYTIVLWTTLMGLLLFLWFRFT